MLHEMYPFWSFILAVVLAQVMKPFVPLLKGDRIAPKLVFSSGGMPSSHTAGVASLCLSVGIQESFNSSLFAVTLAVGLIVAYDAANVRYYSGKNIQVTKQIVKDLKIENQIDLNHPIYQENLKDNLGHKWIEVVSGALVGILTAIVLQYI